MLRDVKILAAIIVLGTIGAFATNHLDRPLKSYIGYYPTGELFCEGFLDEEGKLHGVYKTYDKNGELKTVMNMYHGAMNELTYSTELEEDSNKPN